MDCCNCIIDDNDLIKNYREILLNSEVDKVDKFIPDIRFGLVIKVYDGDTITIIGPVLNALNKTVHKFSIRIRGIDCPEIRTKNTDEKYVSIKARDYARELLMGKIVKLTDISFDKYGRILAKVLINDVDFSMLICEERLAVKYYGGSKKTPKNWRKYYEKS